MATISLAYRASANLTVTALHSLASSQTWVAGWESAVVDNTSDLDLDKLLTAKFTVAASNNQAGQIRIYIVPILDDTPSYADSFDGTESTETITDTEIRDAMAKLLAVIDVDNTASDVYFLASQSIAALFGGVLPPKFSIYVTLNATTTTTAGLAAAGNQITLTGVKLTSA
jgi:hypothetical protein